MQYLQFVFIYLVVAIYGLVWVAGVVRVLDDLILGSGLSVCGYIVVLYLLSPSYGQPKVPDMFFLQFLWQQKWQISLDCWMRLTVLVLLLSKLCCFGYVNISTLMLSLRLGVPTQF